MKSVLMEKLAELFILFSDIMKFFNDRELQRQEMLRILDAAFAKDTPNAICDAASKLHEMLKGQGN